MIKSPLISGIQLAAFHPQRHWIRAGLFVLIMLVWFCLDLRPALQEKDRWIQRSAQKIEQSTLAQTALRHQQQQRQTLLEWRQHFSQLKYAHPSKNRLDRYTWLNQTANETEVEILTVSSPEARPHSFKVTAQGSYAALAKWMNHLQQHGWVLPELALTTQPNRPLQLQITLHPLIETNPLLKGS